MLLAMLALLAAVDPNAYDPLAKGSVGLSFGFPNGGDAPFGSTIAVGATYFFAEKLAVRGDFGLDAQLSPSGRPVLLFVGIGLRGYKVHKGAVALYLFPELTLSREIDGSGNAVEVLALSGGVGAEYFFADRFSIAGQLGVGLALGNLGGPSGSSVTWTLSTATSGLFASVYF